MERNYYALCVPSSTNSDADTTYIEIIIQADSVQQAWELILEQRRINANELEVDWNAQISIEGCYMDIMSIDDVKEAIYQPRFRGHKSELFNVMP